MKTISIDIGGTFIKWAVLDEKLNIVEKGKFETLAFSNKVNGIIKNVSEKANELKEKYNDIFGMGISLPGAIDSNSGEVILETKNIPESQNVNIIEELSKHCEIPTKAINDANAATLGEKAVGSLKDSKNSVLITLGTGIGGGIIINDKIYQGSSFAAGEVGRHFSGEWRWEDAYSTRSLVNNLRLITGEDDYTTEKLLKLHKTNDTAKEQFDNWIVGIAKGISNLIYILNPDTLAIGGGISENSEITEDIIIKSVSKYVNPLILEKTKIVKATTGNDAALYGVALFCREELNIK